MSALLRKAGAAGLLASTLSLGLALPAHAGPLPGLTNLDFSVYTGGAPKNVFTYVKPTGWTGGNGLISIDAPGTATQNVQTHGNSYATWVDPGPVPGGGNYVQADGNPDFESGFNYKLTGLTAGESYSLSFYQAGGQQTGFTNGGNAKIVNTTEQWIVSLGTVGLTVHGSGGIDDPIYGHTGYYSSSDPKASIQASTLMTTPIKGGTPWQYVSVNLVADAATQVLSFLAWGDNGSNVNLPPTVFLTGVNAPPGLVPEPATLSLIGVGLVGLGAARRRRAAR